MNEKNVVPYRIRQARVSREFSMGDLADLIGVSRAAISQYEMGTIRPSDFTLGNMAAVLNYPISFFRKELPIVTSANSAVYFRSQRSSTQKAKNAVREKISIFREINLFLQEYVSFPAVNLPEFYLSNSYRDLTVEEIENYAVALRKFWKLGMGPIDNLTSVLQKNGIMISVMELKNKKIDAFSVLYDSTPYIFRGSDKYSNARLRFDIAHELGHLLLHANMYSEEEIEQKVIRDRIEHEANLFAAAFLLPKETFSKDIYSSSINHFIQLKKKWKTSMAAMIYRCDDLDLLTCNQIKYLKDQMSYNGYWRREPLDNEIPLEKPFAHEQAFSLLLDNDIITPAEIIDKIGCYPEEIERYSFLKKGMLQPTIPDNIIQLRQRSRF